MATISEKGLDDPILIHAGLQLHGAAFGLHPRSKLRLQEKYPEAKIAPKTVFVSYGMPQNWGQVLAPLWDQTATMLTGLKAEDLSALGGVRVFDTEARSIL